ncbi:MAG: hypothetical protein WC974_06200 [Thermoplasmata archaeon]
MNNSIFGRLSLIVFLLLLSAIIATFIPSNAVADVRIASRDISSIWPERSVNVSLKTVNVTVYMERDISFGIANFTLINLKNSTNSFRLAFDPGYHPKSGTACIAVEGTPVSLSDETINNTNVIVFDTQIPALQHQNISVNWAIDSCYYERDYGAWIPYTSSIKHWRCSYKIIGTEAWGSHIESVTIRFVSNCTEFDDATTYRVPDNTTVNENGQKVITFNWNNFSMDSLTVGVSSNKSEYVFDWGGMLFVCEVASPCWVPFLILIVFLIWIRVKRKNRERLHTQKFSKSPPTLKKY